MSIMTTGFHPSFDALSACADQSDLDAARTRVGRHVAKCARCAAAVAEIRALGEAARGVELPAVPAGLWARIEKQASEPAPAPARATPSPERDDVWRPAPALRPTVHQPSASQRRSMRVGLGVLAAAVVLLGVLILTPGPSPLFATAASRITFTPFRPAPGARVQVRYRPSPRMATYDRVVLVGSYAGRLPVRVMDYYFGAAYDSLATLYRTADGAMVGEFTVPSDFLAVALVVEDPTGLTYDGAGDENRHTSWTLVGGDARGRPALSSLLAAANQDMGLGGNGQPILDTLQRYFPDHPAGYALAKRYDGHGLFSDLFEFFKGAERKYASFDAKLERLPRVDADREAAMIAFAYHIEEPGEAAKWTERLSREHPDDPRAFPMYGTMLHQMLMRDISPDSIRRLLPRLDSLARLSLTGLESDEEGTTLVERYGDDAMRRQWALMSVQRRGGSRPYWYRAAVPDRWLGDAEIRDAAVARLQQVVSGSCANQLHYSRRLSYFNWRVNCLRQRMGAFEELSRIDMYEHRVGAARAFADSSIAIDVGEGGCFGRRGYLLNGSANLAAGDTLAAARAFAKSFWYMNSRGRPLRDSLARIVAPAMDSARFNALVGTAEEEGRACLLARQTRQKAAAK